MVSVRLYSCSHRDTSHRIFGKQRAHEKRKMPFVARTSSRSLPSLLRDWTGVLCSRLVVHYSIHPHARIALRACMLRIVMWVL